MAFRRLPEEIKASLSTNRSAFGRVVDRRCRNRPTTGTLGTSLARRRALRGLQRTRREMRRTGERVAIFGITFVQIRSMR